MRTLFLALPACLLIPACGGLDMDDYCGDPQIDAATWEDGSEGTAAELRDGLLGLWEGTATFDGVAEPMTLVINEPSGDPSLITYPEAGEGYSNVQVSDACLDTLEVVLPVQLILEDSGLDIDIELELHETGFSAGWGASQEIAIPGCSAEPCAIKLSFDRYNTDSDEIVGKLRWVDTSVDEEASSISDPNVSLTRITE